MENTSFQISIKQTDTKLVVIVKNNLPVKCSVLVWNTVLDFPYVHGFMLKQEEKIVKYTGPIYQRKFVDNVSTKEFDVDEIITIEYDIVDILQQFNVEVMEAGKPIGIVIANESFSVYDTDASLKNKFESFYKVVAVSNELLVDGRFIEEVLSRREAESQTDLNLSFSTNDVPLCVAGHNDGYVQLGPTSRFVLGFPVTSNLSSAKKDRVNQITRALFELMVFTFKPVKNDALYKKWFGTYSAANLNKVNNAMLSAKPGACPSYIVFDGSGTTSCKPDTYAYIIYTREYNEHPRQCSAGMHYCHRIFLCALFWTRPISGADSQLGILAHELSHGYAYTVDHVYGKLACLDLAKKSPDLAVECADNIRYYIEDLL
ncbi:M35 family metallopeptidase [Mucilaginibacter terrae]|uniref:M35 family metallopeptidase n=1 Tax=Mucilaginibacter terrae TaxID=1955052 RepID=UPI00363E1FBE